MVFDKIQSLSPDRFDCHSRKLHKEPFLLSHVHLTISAFVTICLGTNMADSNRRQDESHVGENQELSELKKRRIWSYKKNIITSWSRGRLKCILLKVNHKNNLNVSRENKGHYFLLTISSVIVSEKISQKVETWSSLCVAVPYPRQVRLHVG